MPERSSRSLAPREHGAYGQLAAPMVAALVAGRPGTTALALLGAALALFFAHEPLAIVVGRRGPRVRREHGRRAGWWLALLGLAGLALAALALVDASPAVWSAAAIAGGLGLVAGGLLVAGVDKTLIGEVVAALALAAAATPIAIAGGVAVATAWWMWSAWALGFAAVTAAVRDVIARGKRRRTAWPPSLLVAVTITTAALTVTDHRAPLAAAPLVAMAVALAIAPAAPRRLRQIGWLLMLATVATATWLVIQLRA